MDRMKQRDGEKTACERERDKEKQWITSWLTRRSKCCLITTEITA